MNLSFYSWCRYLVGENMPYVIFFWGKMVFIVLLKTG